MVSALPPLSVLAARLSSCRASASSESFCISLIVRSDTGSGKRKAEALIHGAEREQRQTLRLTWSGARQYRSHTNHLEEPTDERAVVEGVEVSTDHLVGGERLASSDRFSDVSPIDEQVIAQVARGDADTVDLAVAAADGAADAWGRTPPKERAAVLHRIAHRARARDTEPLR